MGGRGSGQRLIFAHGGGSLWRVMAESSLGLEFGSWEAVKVGGDSPSAR